MSAGGVVQTSLTRGEAHALAESWQARGVPAFPIAISWDNTKGKTNKRPLCAHGHLDATTDLKALRLLFNTMQSLRDGEVYGVGLHPGPAGLLVVDVDGAGNVDTYERRDLPATYSPTTGSGAKHYWYRKREPGWVGTRCPWPEVDVVRSDDGWIVAPGTVTPWGEWISHDSYPDDVAECPTDLWGTLEATRDTSRPGNTSSAKGHDVDQLVAKLVTAGRDQDAEALRVLCARYGAHHPFMKGDELFVTRPDKSSGTSASIGYSAPGVVKMFSSDWSPFEEQKRYIVSGDQLVDADAALKLATTDRASSANAAPKRRHVRPTPASAIQPRRVRWLWHERVALGTLALLAGREGIGKSLLAYWVAARITRGELPGEYLGQPRSVLVCATEDSWAHTIVPRLIAHGADLEHVYRIDVVVDGALHAELSLPGDLADVERLAAELDVALLVLDPLMSRLDASLDTHRDGEVRQALEPLVAVCDTAGMSVLGLIHHNKSGSTDPLQVIMASKAFPAVARSVNTVLVDPDDETGARRLFGTPKSNLGRSDLPVLSFTVNGWQYDTDDGPGWTGQLAWGDDIDGTIHDVMSRAARDPDKRTAETSAVGWLRDYMAEHARELLDLDGEHGVEAADIRDAAEANGHARTTLQRAKDALGVVAVKGRGTFKNRWFWTLPGEDSARAWGDTHMESSSSLESSVPGQHEDAEDSKIPAPEPSGLFDAPDCPACAQFGEWPTGCPHGEL